VIDKNTKLLISKAKLTVNDLALAENADTQNLVNLKSLNISPISFDLAQRKLSLGNISLDQPDISVLRYPDNKLNILKPLAPKTAQPPAEDTTEHSNTPKSPDPIDPPEETAKKSGFEWDIASIKIGSGSVNWRDQSLSTPADLIIDNIQISLGALTSDLSQAFPYEISFNTGASAQSLSGSLSPQPFNVEGGLALQALPLNWLQNYVSETTNIRIDSGSADLNSQYQLSMNETLSGLIEADIALNQVAVSDAVLNKPISGFEQFSVGPVNMQLGNEKVIQIDTIGLAKPYADIFIADNGQMNLASLSKKTEEAEEPEPQQKPTTETQAAIQETEKNTENSSNKMTINIDKFSLDAAKFTFTDASQTPNVSTYFDQVTGTIENLSSNPDTKSKVDIQGNLETYGKLLIQGTLNPLSQKPYTDLGIKVSNINLSTASPYSGKFAGYLIDKGKLDLNLNYKIDDKKLDANNHIFIDQFEFGEPVDSPDATSLPLPLAIGILKNLDGEIDIDLPISGELDDPSFSIGGVLFTAFTNLITSVVTSPFSILGSLVEGGDDISSVTFTASSATLAPEQTSKILKLSSALKDRPTLNLEIRGVSSLAIDGNTDLVLLAKSRAQNIAQTIIEQGGIDKERIFILEPEIQTETLDPEADTLDSKAKNTHQAEAPKTIASSFTINVR